MNQTIHRSKERGHRDHGWLQARFSFSFADYWNPTRMGFGKLRVLNDDTIAAGRGFGKHPHDNMEIITIPQFGEIAHEDSTGSKEVIRPGQIQVMSAGSGIVHSEFNNSQDQEARMFQMWIETAHPNVDPRHETKDLNLKKNELNKIVSGNKEDDAIFIYQDASVYLGEFDEEKELHLDASSTRGLFIMVVEGTVIINNEALEQRDSIEIVGPTPINILTKKGTKLLVVDTPM